MKSKIRFQNSATTGTANGQAVGYTVNGSALSVGKESGGPKLGTLSAFVAADCTGGVTWTPSWQISNDATNYYNVSPAANVADVAISTTTTGKVIDAPNAVYGARYARLKLVTGGVTGVTVNTCGISYNYAVD